MLEYQNNLVEAHSSLVIVNGKLSDQHSRMHPNVQIKNDDIIGITISPTTGVQSIIHISYISTQDVKNNIKVTVEAGASVSLIENFQKDKNISNKIDLHLQEFSYFTHQKHQNLERTATYNSDLNIVQQKNSQYKSIYIANGSLNSAEVVSIAFEGEDAKCEFNGLLKAKESQQMSYKICVDHKVGHCTSVQNIKGIMSENAIANIDSKAIVQKNSVKSEAHQYLHNLLLDKNATVNLIPQLEIYSDDVKCSHGATVGQLDEDALFFLQARGIGYGDAKHLLIEAFSKEITEKSIAGRIRL